MTARDPIADLRRIAFLLEKANEATYRVRAFRSAANALAALPTGEVAERARTGRLTELAGVGDVTARCVAESLAGEEPVYLRRLVATEGTDLDAAAAALRDALRGDCHTPLRLVGRRAHRSRRWPCRRSNWPATRIWC